MILKKECYNDERAIKKGNSLMLKKVIKEAFPTVLAFTMSGMYSIVDGIFVGKAAGDTGLAAINIAWPIPALITALGIGIGTEEVFCTLITEGGESRRYVKICLSLQ